MRILVMGYSKKHYGIFIGPEDGFLSDDIYHIKNVLDIPLNNSELRDIIDLMNGHIDPFDRAMFDRKRDAEQCKEWLEQYLIMFKLTG